MQGKATLSLTILRLKASDSAIIITMEIMLEEWRFCTMERGGLFVIIFGIIQMLLWPAGKL